MDAGEFTERPLGRSRQVCSPLYLYRSPLTLLSPRAIIPTTTGAAVKAGRRVYSLTHPATFLLVDWSLLERTTG